MPNDEGVVLTAQAQYWHSAHLAETLLATGAMLERIIESVPDNDGIGPDDIFRDPKGELAHIMLEYVAERRPNSGKSDPILDMVRDDFTSLLKECRGQTYLDVLRRMWSVIQDCVTIFKDWINRLEPHVENVTQASCFQWVEFAETICDGEIDVEGRDGRLARIRRVSNMLDHVITVGDVASCEERALCDLSDDGGNVSVAPVDRFTVEVSAPSTVRQPLEPEEADGVVDHFPSAAFAEVVEAVRAAVKRAQSASQDDLALKSMDEDGGPPPAYDDSAPPSEALDELVTLNQAAVLAAMSKRTLERYVTKGDLPEPDFRGGGGKAHKWYWRNLRAALEKLSKRILPERYPGSRII